MSYHSLHPHISRPWTFQRLLAGGLRLALSILLPAGLFADLLVDRIGRRHEFQYRVAQGTQLAQLLESILHVLDRDLLLRLLVIVRLLRDIAALLRAALQLRGAAEEEQRQEQQEHDASVGFHSFGREFYTRVLVITEPTTPAALTRSSPYRATRLYEARD